MSEPLSTQPERLRKDLVEAGIADGDRGRHTTTIRIDGRTKRVLGLNIAGIESLLGETFPTTNHQNHHYHHSWEGGRDPL